MDCVYIHFILFKSLCNSEYLHINIPVALNSGDSIECQSPNYC